MTSVFRDTAVAIVFSAMAGISASAQEAGKPAPENTRHEYSVEQAEPQHKETSLERCRRDSLFRGSVPDDLRGKDVLTLFDPYVLTKGDPEAVRYVDLEAASKDGSLEKILDGHFTRILSDPIYAGPRGGGILELVLQSHDMGMTFHPALTPQGTISPASKLRFANTKYCTVNLGGVFTIEDAMGNMKVQLAAVGYLPRKPYYRLAPVMTGAPADGLFNPNPQHWVPELHSGN